MIMRQGGKSNYLITLEEEKTASSIKVIWLFYHYYLHFSMHMYVRRSVLSKHFPLIAPAACTIRFECLRKQGYKKMERVLAKKKKSLGKGPE